MNTKPIQDNATRTETIRRWTKVKTTAALIVVCGILLGTAGTVIAVNSSFKAAAKGPQPVPVDSLATSISDGLQTGMWFTPVIVCSAILWFAARAKLKTLNLSSAFSARNAD